MADKKLEVLVKELAKQIKGFGKIILNVYIVFIIVHKEQYNKKQNCILNIY